MARMTPHALSQTTRETPRVRPFQSTLSPEADRARRIARMRKDVAWADRTSENYVRQTMAGRYGVRM